MVVHGLTCQLLLAASICVVAIGENPCWRNLVNQEITKPKNIVLRCPRVFTVAVQAMDCNNTVDEKLSYQGDLHDVLATYSTMGEIPEASSLIPRPEASADPTVSFNL